MMNKISIQGAKEHNLKNINFEIPRNKLVCFVGVSGSGKSTIAFDIIAKEGQRQYLESLSAYARRYLSKNNRPKIKSIKGISSTIIIKQERLQNNPRSTVGTITETYNYLRLLFSRVGLPILDSSHFSFNHPHGACPLCKGLGKVIEFDQNKLINFEKSLNQGAILSSAWKVNSRQWQIIKATGYFEMDKKLKDYSKEELNKLLYADSEMLSDNNYGFIQRWTFQGIISRLKKISSNIYRGFSKRDKAYLSSYDCYQCQGYRLNNQSLQVKIHGKNIGQIANIPIYKSLQFIKKVTQQQAKVIKPRLIKQLKFLINVGLGYLSLNRSVTTLSGGESQRVKLAKQLESNLIETIYVLDEPTAGLHPKDIQIIINNLKKIRDKGNTVLVVEHEPSVIKNADYLIELGPGGGKQGGQIIASGSLSKINQSKKSIIKKYLSHRQQSFKPRKMKFNPSEYLLVKKANKNNLKNISLNIPLNGLIVISGVSGAGKSSLAEEIISQNKKKIILIEQRPIGRSNRSAIATYIGIFDYIRQLFSQTTGIRPGLFSFNSKGGCFECKGIGYINMDMNFLGNVKIICQNCKGKRYRKKVLRYKYKNKDICQVLTMTVKEAFEFFNHSAITKQLKLLVDVGLDYITLGQTLNTFSGGESQRLKLATRLDNQEEIYILDEPTISLHPSDIDKLLALIKNIIKNKNTVIVIEHDIKIMRNADWIIDMGPEGGNKGGQIIASGPPEKIMKTKDSYTGQYLKKYLMD